MASRPAWMIPTGEGWRCRSERVVFETPWIRVRACETVAPTGAPASYGVVGFKNQAIAILPIHEDGTVTLVGQHRFPAGDYSWEVPEGGAPLSEDPLEGARRELREEAGLEAAEWRRVLTLQLSNSVTDEVGIGYIATGLTPCRTEPDATEALAIVRAPFSEALEQALQGGIQDSLSVAILLRAYHMAREEGLPERLARAMLGEGGE